MGFFRNLFLVVVGVPLGFFIFLNFKQPVVIYYTSDLHTQEMPLSLALFGAMLAGILLAAFLGIADQIRIRARLGQMRRTVERLESELSALRNLPLTDSLSEKKGPGGAPGSS